MFFDQDIPNRYADNRQRALENPRLHVVDSKTMQDQLNLLRDKSSPVSVFRSAANKVTFDVMKGLVDNAEREEITIETPMTTFRSEQMASDDYTLVPILRGGIAMIQGALKVLPNAGLAFIGMYRDEITHKPVEYYHLNAPKNISAHKVIIIDPMLATGGSINDTIDAITREGVGETNIQVACIFAAPEGVAAISETHPAVEIYAASLDWGLNSKAYIMPGAGDFGDRWCKTT